MALILAACTIAGCATTGDRADVKYSNLSTREVQAIYPADFEAVHAACLNVLRAQLGYTVSSEDHDSTLGRSRIEAALSDGGSVRIETERSRDLASTSVKAFAVDAGASEASAERARAILDKVESVLWSGKQ